VIVGSSVPDLQRFDLDPDLRIRTTGFRLKSLLFSSLAFKMPTKIIFFYNFFAYYLPFFITL
jgi:hypothetical protein